MLIKQGGAGGGVDAGNRPNITFDGKWSGWHIEFYDEEAYWEALLQTSGTLSVSGQYTADAWGIGGGGASGQYYRSGYVYKTGGGSGYTNMATDMALSGSVAVTIGAGATTQRILGNTEREGEQGGTTSFLSLSCSGGNGGRGDSQSGGAGGSNGAGSGNGGENGSPGAGKIMSKFWSVEHNTEYGKGGNAMSSTGGGGGGYLEVGKSDGPEGHGFGAGGGSVEGDTGFQGNAGCLVIRIKA